MEFEGHIKSTKSHLSLLLFLAALFRCSSLTSISSGVSRFGGEGCRGGTLGTALSFPIPFSRRDDVTFRRTFAWCEEKLEVVVNGGSPRGDDGIVWPGVVVEVKVDGANGAGGRVDRRSSPLVDKRRQLRWR